MKAQNEITQLNNTVNESIKEKEHMNKMLEIQHRITNKPIKDVLVAPHRRYIYEGDLMKISKKKPLKKHFALFSDILFYGIVSGGNYTIEKKCHLRYVYVRGFEDNSFLQNAIGIKYTNKIITLTANSSEEKK
eukprot:Anaeramoba_ignava/c17676_g1_i1.p2 GENE.c17676_g1_i1~~c17676_g1_i1.p2  ORF type:complete len:133 (-),score=40.06 c17676_g1_i1:370-768(-)